MCHPSTSACAGQSSLLFDVVAVDRLGKHHAILGRGLLQSGAVSQAAGYNAGNASGLVAIVIPAGSDSAAEGTDPGFGPSRRLMIMTGRAKQFLLPVFCPDEDLEFYKDIIDDCESVDIVEDCGAANAESAPSTALDASSEQDDSDVDQGDENAAGEAPEVSIPDDIDYELDLMVAEAENAAAKGDLSLIITVGMRYALCRYLHSVIEAVMANKVRHSCDVGMIAAGLERFCVQVIGGTDPEPSQGFYDWTCEAFGEGQSGDMSNDYGTTEALSEWFDTLAEPAI